MTKFQIFSPTGAKVCVIEAVSKVTNGDYIYFYDYVFDGFQNNQILADIPSSWAAIPISCIVTEGTGQECVLFNDCNPD